MEADRGVGSLKRTLAAYDAAARGQDPDFHRIYAWMSVVERKLAPLL